MSKLEAVFSLQQLPVFALRFVAISCAIFWILLGLELYTYTYFIWLTRMTKGG